jgi:hypothetical protein
MSKLNLPSFPRLAKNRSRKNRSPLVKRIRKIGFRALGSFGAFLLIFVGISVNESRTHQTDLVTAASDVGRQMGLGPLVALAEDIYYQSIGAPPIGGKPKDSASFDGKTSWGNRKVGKVAAHPKQVFRKWPAATFPSNLPPRVASPVAPTPMEGVWVPTKIAVNGVTAVYVARVRPDALHTSLYATLAWFDPHLLSFREIPGTSMPEGNFNRGNGRVPASLRKFYIAGFASGYHLVDAQGGFSYNGQLVKKLVKGKATLLTFPDGSIRIVKWGREKVKPGYNTARQNLDLLVDHSKSQVLDESQARWGLAWRGTGSGKNYVWRSGIGERADGSIVYVQSAALSAKNLAELLVRGGAVRAMALDMNISWAKGFFYGPYGSKGVPINPNSSQRPASFWDSSSRDYIAVFVRSPRHG